MFDFEGLLRDVQAYKSLSRAERVELLAKFKAREARYTKIVCICIIVSVAATAGLLAFIFNVHAP